MDKEVMEFMDKVEKKIEAQGWIIIHTENEDGIPYSYSVGLNEKFNNLDILIIGLYADKAQDLIHNVKNLLIEGLMLKDGQELKEVANFPLVLKEISDKNVHEYCKVLKCRNPEAKSYQLVWPDSQGNFAWDAEYDEQFRFQKELWK